MFHDQYWISLNLIKAIKNGFNPVKKTGFRVSCHFMPQ